MSFAEVGGFDPTNDLEFSMVVNDTATAGLDQPQGQQSGQSQQNQPQDQQQQQPQEVVKEDDFTRSMRLISQQLNTVAGKVSEPGIRRLATTHGFEIFDEQIDDNTKRISLGGTIVLVDIDFREEKVVNAKLNLGSTVQVSDDKRAFNQNEQSPTVDELLLKALQRPLLDEFSIMLQHIARADHLSIPTAADCFTCMDEVAIALMKIHDQEQNKVDPSCEYGVPVQNPKKHLGLGIWYWTSKQHVEQEETPDDDKLFAFLTMMSIDNASMQLQPEQHLYLEKCTMKYSADWLKDVNSRQWNDPESIASAKGVFVLELSPPVVITKDMATKLHAIDPVPVDDSCDDLQRVKRTVYMPNHGRESVQFTYVQALPEPLVRVEHIPLEHPRDIPEILRILRKYQFLRNVWESIHRIERDETYDNQEPEDISFADAIMEYENLERDNNRGNNEMRLVSVLMCELNNDIGYKIGLTNYDDTFELYADSDGLQIKPENEVSSKFKQALELTEDLAISCLFVDRMIGVGVGGGRGSISGGPRKFSTSSNHHINNTTTSHNSTDRKTSFASTAAAEKTDDNTSTAQLY